MTKKQGRTVTRYHSLFLPLLCTGVLTRMAAASLVAFLGDSKTSAFKDLEIAGLDQEGYDTVDSLKVASREGLRACGLRHSCVDMILAAQGEFW